MPEEARHRFPVQPLAVDAVHDEPTQKQADRVLGQSSRTTRQGKGPRSERRAVFKRLEGSGLQQRHGTRRRGGWQMELKNLPEFFEASASTLQDDA